MSWTIRIQLLKGEPGDAPNLVQKQEEEFVLPRAIADYVALDFFSNFTAHIRFMVDLANTVLCRSPRG